MGIFSNSYTFAGLRDIWVVEVVEVAIRIPAYNNYNITKHSLFFSKSLILLGLNLKYLKMILLLHLEEEFAIIIYNTLQARIMAQSVFLET